MVEKICEWIMTKSGILDRLTQTEARVEELAMKVVALKAENAELRQQAQPKHSDNFAELLDEYLNGEVRR